MPGDRCGRAPLRGPQPAAGGGQRAGQPATQSCARAASARRALLPLSPACVFFSSFPAGGSPLPTAARSAGSRRSGASCPRRCSSEATSGSRAARWEPWEVRAWCVRVRARVCCTVLATPRCRQAWVLPARPPACPGAGRPACRASAIIWPRCADQPSRAAAAAFPASKRRWWRPRRSRAVQRRQGAGHCPGQELQEQDLVQGRGRLRRGQGELLPGSRVCCVSGWCLEPKVDWVHSGRSAAAVRQPPPPLAHPTPPTNQPTNQYIYLSI